MPISPSRYKQEFLASDVAADIKRQLQQMARDPAYVTKTVYSPSNDGGPDTPFAEQHLLYLSTHPKVDPRAYLSNLRLKTKLSNRQR